MDYNKVILGGNLTREPEMQYLPSQTAVVSFGMAINRHWKGQDGQKNKEVCFVDLVCFGKQGETLNKYAHKGDPLLVEGRLKHDSWTAKDGTKRNKTKVVVENFQFIAEPKKEAPASTETGGQANPDYVPDRPAEDDTIPF